MPAVPSVRTRQYLMTHSACPLLRAHPYSQEQRRPTLARPAPPQEQGSRGGSMQPGYAGCARATKHCVYEYTARNMWLMAKGAGTAASPDQQVTSGKQRSSP